MDSSRRHRLLEKATRYEQVLITTTDLEQVSDFFGSGANYRYVSGGQVWPSDQYGIVADSPVSYEDDGREAKEETHGAIDESA